MKEFYSVRVPGHKVCIADVSPGICGHHYIARINVPVELRGRGYARDILKQILEDADSEGIALCLFPVPSDGLDGQQLRLWYQRHGFVRAGKQERCGMVRKPHDYD